MRDKISALMDDELDDSSAGAAITALGRDGEALEAWRTYHLISDAMRDGRLLSAGFTARITARLAAEPIVPAPSGLVAAPRRRLLLPAAASAAAVALVAWLAFAPQPQQQAVPQMAEAKPPAVVPLTNAANDYLLAHQGFSPRISLQGMAPYVRTVSEQAPEVRK